MDPLSENQEDRILILAPTGGDAKNVHSILVQHKLEGRICSDLPELCRVMMQGAGVLLIAEEALAVNSLPLLLKILQEQAAWSDIPLLLVTSGGETTQASFRVFNAFGSSGNITLMERPFRAITLVSALQVGLRARRRQCQTRGLMENLEQRVAERTRKLEETISELEAFSYSVSHDLRAPLRAMHGYSHVLIEDFSEGMDQEAREYIRRILTASERLDRLIQDILTYSRFARSDIEVSSIGLESLVNDIVQQYPSLQSPRAEVEVQAPLLSVTGHVASLTQCVSNLLTNAVKFVTPGTVPRVRIWTELVDSCVRIWIQDNGIGIPQAHQNRIFCMFERGPHAAAYEGTGIGLAIVKKAVERMGGKVGVQSEVGEGSKFWIQLAAA
jgi:signal transduction histidine kinase